MKGPPISVNVREHNKGRYRKWIETVRAAAKAQWPKGQMPTSQEVVAVLTNYYSAIPPDVDNIVKPILDALKGLVYNDDNQVRKLISERFNLTTGAPVSVSSASLADALARWDAIIQVVISWGEEDG
jgi:crossover junction endodeoxyribonuclease RusA